jgi:hypothetical protein
LHWTSPCPWPWVSSTSTTEAWTWKTSKRNKLWTSISENLKKRKSKQPTQATNQCWNSRRSSINKWINNKRPSVWNWKTWRSKLNLMRRSRNCMRRKQRQLSYTKRRSNWPTTPTQWLSDVSIGRLWRRGSWSLTMCS